MKVQQWHQYWQQINTSCHYPEQFWERKRFRLNCTKTWGWNCGSIRKTISKSKSTISHFWQVSRPYQFPFSWMILLERPPPLVSSPPIFPMLVEVGEFINELPKSSRNNDLSPVIYSQMQNQLLPSNTGVIPKGFRNETEKLMGLGASCTKILRKNPIRIVLHQYSCWWMERISFAHPALPMVNPGTGHIVPHQRVIRNAAKCKFLIICKLWYWQSFSLLRMWSSKVHGKRFLKHCKNNILWQKFELFELLNSGPLRIKWKVVCL